jgi:hypothetical protein
MLTIGTIPIIERGVGFDRSLWRLPALIVDDFSLVTEELMMQAYIEAIYHADQFEFHRLRQSVSACIPLLCVFVCMYLRTCVIIKPGQRSRLLYSHSLTDVNGCDIYSLILLPLYCLSVYLSVCPVLV